MMLRFNNLPHIPYSIPIRYLQLKTEALNPNLPTRKPLTGRRFGRLDDINAGFRLLSSWSCFRAFLRVKARLWLRPVSDSLEGTLSSMKEANPV